MCHEHFLPSRFLMKVTAKFNIPLIVIVRKFSSVSKT